MGTVPVALQSTAAFTDPKTGLLTPYGYQTLLKLIQWGGGILPIDLADPLEVTNRLPYANQPTLAASHLLGRESGSAGNEEPISLGTGLSMTGPVLDVVGSTLLSTTVTVTNAEMLTLPTTPVSLVPAPGAAFQLVPLLVDVRGNTTGGAYTNIDPDGWIVLAFNGTDIWSNYLTNDSTIGYTFLSTTLGAAGDFCFQFVPFTLAEPIFGWGNLVDPRGNVEPNQPLVLTSENFGSGNFTGGHSANLLVLTTYYTVVAVGV